MLKLLVDPIVDSATIPITWCITREMYKEIAERKMQNPQVFIVVRPKGTGKYTEKRYIVSLDSMKTYVVFDRPGAHDVFATLVWNLDGKVSRIEDSLLRGDEGLYLTDVLRRDGSGFLPDLSEWHAYESLGAAKIELEIPANLFAKKPPQWLQDWVRLWCTGPTRDQCHFRKRAMKVFLPTLVWIPLSMLLRSLFALLCFACGLRGVNLRAIVHPFRNNFDDIGRETDKQYSLFTGETKDKLPIFWAIPFAPIFMACVFAVCCIIAHRHHHDLRWTALYAALAVAASVGIAAVLNTVLIVLARTIGTENYKAQRQAAKEQQKQEKFAAAQHRQETLVCDSPQFSHRLKALPRTQRIRLYYWEVKAAVCKPFSR